MKKARLLANTICQEYSASANAKKLPKLNPVLINENGSDFFKAKYSAGTISFEAENPLVAVYGLLRMQASSLSGHLGEFLGEHTPRFPLRPLLIDIEQLNTDIYKCCQRIIELGYNAVVLETVLLTTLKEFFSVFQDFGLKLIVFADSESQISEISAYTDYIFWKSSYTKQSDFSQVTDFELACEEVRKIEALLPPKKGLIYQIQARNLEEAQKQAKWFPKFCDEVSDSTLISFSSYINAKELHPFWEALRSCPDVSSTQLLPLINGGSLEMGEGLWPIISLKLFSICFERMHRHRFAGAIIQAKELSNPGGLLDCNLWIAGALLWNKEPVNLLAETWFKAYRPGMNYSQFSDEIEVMESIALGVNVLKLELNPEKCRAKSEALICQLNMLQVVFAEEKKSEGRGELSLSDYFSYFNRDIRRIILNITQGLNIALPHLLEGMDDQESFWTKLIEASSMGPRVTTKAEILEKPNLDFADDMMQLIFEENRLFPSR